MSNSVFTTTELLLIEQNKKQASNEWVSPSLCLICILGGKKSKRNNILELAYVRNANTEPISNKIIFE